MPMIFLISHIYDKKSQDLAQKEINRVLRTFYVLPKRQKNIDSLNSAPGTQPLNDCYTACRKPQHPILTILFENNLCKNSLNVILL